jgi:hypothetical protein
MSNKARSDYWADCIAVAAEECGMILMEDQLEYLVDAVKGAHENYGMAFYSPPSSDRISSIERDWKTKYEALQLELDAYRSNAEKAVVRALHLPSWAKVSIDQYGYVKRTDR